MSAGTNREKIKAVIHLTYINSAKVQIGKKIKVVMHLYKGYVVVVVVMHLYK